MLFVCGLNLLDSGILFGLHLHSFYFAGMVAGGWDGCNGLVLGARVQALLDFCVFKVEVAQAPRGSHI